MSRILGLDVSTKTIGISLFEDFGDNGKLQLLTHITPIVKPKPESKFLEGPRSRTYEFFFLFRVLFEFVKGYRALHFIGPCISVFGSAILLESGLSFLGLGLAPPAPSWGMMIKENYPYIMFDSAYLAIVPGLVIMLLVMGFNFLGIALRDALDINLK